jgi:hypothetical protein
MKTQVVGSVSEFLNGRQVEESLGAKVERHINKYGSFYRIGAVTVVILLSGGHALAAGLMDTSPLDREAIKIYHEIVRIGKWLIIIKGGIDIIKCIGDGDFQAAKKHCFSYIMIYLLLLGLPYGMQKVDMVFDNITT